MLNAKGVAYRAGKADMSNDEDKEEEDKKEGVASTPSHGLPLKISWIVATSSSQTALHHG